MITSHGRFADVAHRPKTMITSTTAASTNLHGIIWMYLLWNAIFLTEGNPVKEEMCGINETPYKLNCYWIPLRKRSWNEAVRFCKRKGGVLSDLIEKEDLEFLTAFLSSSSITNVWVHVSKLDAKINPKCWKNESMFIPAAALCCSYSVESHMDLRNLPIFNCTDKKNFACKLPKNRVSHVESQRNLIRYIREVPDEEEYADVMHSEKSYPMLAFRVIACCTLIILVGITVIIYTTTKMFFNECIAHISCSFALLGAYTCILITTCESYYISHSLCLSVSIFLQFFFLVVFSCHLLEMVIISRMLLSWFPCIFINRFPLLIVGWGLPAGITILTVIVAHDHFITSVDNCWMNINNGIKWVTIIPVGICVGIHIILLLMVLIIREIPSKISPKDVKRARNALSARWASAILIVFLTLVWSTGLMATYRNSEAFYGVFCVITIILGAMILILRISTESEVRKRITLAFTSSPVLVTQQPLWISTSFDSESHSLYNHMPKTPVQNS